VTYARKHLTKESTSVLHLALENPAPCTSELDTPNVALLEGCEEARGQPESYYPIKAERVQGEWQ
jgi:hypothetical protein